MLCIRDDRCREKRSRHSRVPRSIAPRFSRSTSNRSSRRIGVIFAPFFRPIFCTELLLLRFTRTKCSHTAKMLSPCLIEKTVVLLVFSKISKWVSREKCASFFFVSCSASDWIAENWHLFFASSSSLKSFLVEVFLLLFILCLKIGTWQDDHGFKRRRRMAKVLNEYDPILLANGNLICQQIIV